MAKPGTAATPATTDSGRIEAPAQAAPGGSARSTAPRGLLGNAPPNSQSTAEHVDRARVVQRVAGAIQRAQLRDGNIRVRLSPPELGSLRIELSVREGVMTASIEAETPTARTVIMENLPVLRERLAEQDIRIERFEVEVGADADGRSQHQSTEDRERPRASLTPQRLRRQSPSTPQAPAPTQASLSADAGLDVRI